MDTKTGKIVISETQKAQAKWDAWKVGLLRKKPRYTPISKDFTGRKGKKGIKARRSYKDFCR